MQLIVDTGKERVQSGTMPRQPRVDSPGTLHHLTGRGLEGTKIFRAALDRKDFGGGVTKLCKAGAFKVFAWALMDHHVHLLIRSGEQSLARSMRKLLTGYVVNFNRRYKRYGHLFQNRYKSIICEEDPYLLEGRGRRWEVRARKTF